MAGQQYEEGQHLQGSDGNVYVVQGGVPVLAQPASSPGIVTKLADPRRPYEAPLAQAELGGKQVSAATDRAQLPYVAPRASAEADKAQADAEAARLNLEKLRREVLKAPASQNALSNLQRAIDDIKAKYAAGPGQTSGISGLADYLPTDANLQFDAAGNAVRGFVGPALGLTGGQLNTEKEAQRAVGPYIPQSSDRDSVIEDKIARLQGLADSMRASIPSLAPPNRDGAASGGGMPTGGAMPPSGLPPIPPGAPPAPMPPGAPMGDKSTKWFGNGGAGADQYGMTTSMKAENLQKDPTRVAAAKHLAAMLANRNIPDAQIRAYAENLNVSPESLEANLKFRRDHPTYTGGYNTNSLGFKNVPLTATEWIGNNIGASPLGTAAITGGNAVSGNSLAHLTSNPDATRAMIEGVSKLNPKSAFAGNIGGGALAAAGLEAGAGGLAAKLGLGAKALPWVPRAADAAYGAISGANSNPNDPLKGALFGGAAGLGGGMFGRQIARSGGGALAGVRNEGVQMLKDRGIPLTFGQAVSQSGRLGGMAKGIEDKLTSLPLVGDMINARRREGVQGFNAAAFKEGMAPIAPLIPPVGQQGVNNVGEQGISDMQKAVTGSYGRALDGVQVTPDAQFAQELSGLLQKGAAIPRTGPEFAHTVNASIAPHFNSPTGAVGGAQIQDILQTTRGTNFGNDAMGNFANDALGDVGGAVSDLVGRHAPGVIPALGAANSSYRNLNILADAVGKGANTGGLFSPAQLGMAARSNTTKFGGKISAASDTRPFFDLQRAGQDILPSKVPDSGTSGRLAMLAVPGLAGATGAGAGYAAGDVQTGSEAGLATLTALALGGSKTAQKLLTAMVLNRSKGMVTAGEALGKRAPVGGMFGAAASPLLLPQQ